jgi:hypothetical protein
VTGSMLFAPLDGMEEPTRHVASVGSDNSEDGVAFPTVNLLSAVPSYATSPPGNREMARISWYCSVPDQRIVDMKGKLRGATVRASAQRRASRIPAAARLTALPTNAFIASALQQLK